MDSLSRLSRALVEEGGYRSLSEIGLPSSVNLPVEKFPFTAVKHHWGSVATVSLLPGDGKVQEEIRGLFGEFFRFTQSLKQHARSIVIHQEIGPTTEVKLGSFGVLGFIFENGCPDRLVPWIQDQKKLLFGEKVSAVSWVLDAKARKVTRHRWFPFFMPPRKKFLEAVLARL